MALNKKEEFKEIEQKAAAFAKALSHPARISILTTLAKRNECICGELVDVLPLSQSTVSQHLAELKKIGIIKGTINGPRSCYCIDWQILNKHIDTFEKAVKSLVIKNKKCC
jgi:DNA-binding transcriptional ArsR family regulator